MALYTFIRRVLKIHFVRYLIVGGINTCFSYIVFASSVYLLKYVNLAVVVATIISILFNFNTYGRIVFKSKDNSKIYRFFGVYLFTMTLQILLLKALALTGVTNPYIAGGILTLPLAAVSFLLMRKFVFNTITFR